MNSFQARTSSPEETIKLAEELGKKLSAGDVITLAGDLGAGKTHFTKGIAAALQVQRTLNSPTFTIMKQYEGTLPLYHMDLYRLGEEEAEELGLEEYFEGAGICVIEWSEKLTELLPTQRLHIDIKREGDSSRLLEFCPHGERFDLLCKEMQMK
ncbi:tRNA (adenosine(37)-N6)-threonylcarbamoyltransferase complex ATPase subunit type 1 TsaE [Alteribacillus sp. HJP-4]|uniref:tRNA (adenosine(37)-N6)-threonylcarbamoyltransferase complex ATPase subunit type 1 TsaE n=1 Tax=Alteribacillus sp. HJP-4 TaxID=2775394 RepID=UPI0035CD2354